MAKKQNEATPNVNATANRDIVQRLNFLYQASVYLQSIAPPAPTETSRTRKGKAKQTENDKEGDSMGMIIVQEASASSSTAGKHVGGKKHKHKVGRKKTTGDLARSYIQCMRVVGQKTTVKMCVSSATPVIFTSDAKYSEIRP
jgi:ribonuclease P protein subunit RPR2